MPSQALSPAQLRWRVPPGVLGFETTADLDPLTAFIGQDPAIAALRRGVEMEGPGFNVFVVGMLSSGRLATLERILREIGPPRRRACDFVYVRNFVDSARPRLLTFPAGRGILFRKELIRLATLLVEEMPRILNADPIRRAREAQTHALEVAQGAAIQRLEAHAKKLGFLIGVADEEDGEPVVMWLRPDTEGEEHPAALTRAALQVALDADEVPRPANLDEIWKGYDTLEAELAGALDIARQKVMETARSVSEAEAEAVRHGTRGFFRDLARRWPAARAWLHDLNEELVESPEWFDEEEPAHEPMFATFSANVVHVGSRSRKAPIVVVSNPTWAQLFGGIEGEPGGIDHRGLRGGALLDADGGYLVLNAADLVQEPGAWKVIKRVLMYGDVDIQNPEGPGIGPITLRPDSLRVDVKFVFIGDPMTYAALYYSDPDVRSLFKIKAEFEDDTDLTDETLRAYSRFCSRLVEKEQLPAIHRSGVEAVLEHAVRLGGRAGRITTQLGQLSDLVREAAYESKGELIQRTHVEAALRARRDRDNLAERRTLEMLRRGVIRVDVDGTRIGAVNGLVVYHVGGHDFGRPLRITATAGVGRGGLVNIEREAGLSGRSHDKGVQILAGLVREHLGRTRTLALTASLAFEQSYGRIDGDSASVAELVVLLSAIARVPVEQGIAVTGSINQLGEVQGVGGVNEKIEGFYTACALDGLTGHQGVIIPADNVPDLHLSPEVVEACAAGRFHVWGVSHVGEAIEKMTGLPSGFTADSPDSVLARAARALDHFQDVARLQGKKPPPS